MSEKESEISGSGVAFGPFHLLVREKLLFEGKRSLRLGGRALDILIALTARAGKVVTKDELMAIVWPNTFVDEANLRVHVSALRRTLGDGQEGARYIVNAAGRGYSFVAPVTSIEDNLHTASQPPRPRPGSNLPALLTRIVGRADAIDAISVQLSSHRLVSVVGPGGIGKTTIALAVGERLAERYASGIYYVDLSPVADADLVASAVASAIEIPIVSEKPIPNLIAFFRDEDAMLVLDTCEHVVEACATFVEALLQGAPRVSILTTSREPLRAAGERVYRLPPLATPPSTQNLTAAEAIEFSSIRLFAERAASNLDTFELSDVEAPIVGEICRRLDGIPLAIEMAAAHVDVFGVHGIAQRLVDAFALQTQGRRTALPRHQTLRAMLDWSYALLTTREQSTIRRLAVFSGGFTLQAAITIAAESDPTELIANLTNLVTKSLVTADISGAVVSYRLLDTTRAYAREKLLESGEFRTVAYRHAKYFSELFSRAEAELTKMSAAEWSSLYGRHLDNARAALDWAFSIDGDAELGIALTIAVAPLWLHLLLNEECRVRTETALASLNATNGQDSRQAMHLQAALGNTLLYTKRAGFQASIVWRHTLAIAERLQDADYQLRALRGLWADTLNGGDIQSAQTYAAKFREVASLSENGSDPLVADRLLAQVLYFRGDLKIARSHFERMLARYPPHVAPLDAVRFQFDQRMIARADFSRILWFQGYLEQALYLIETTVEGTGDIDNPISMNYALAHVACPIALYAGHVELADRFLAMLLQRASRGPHPWDLWARSWQAVLLCRQGDALGGARILAETLEAIPLSAFHMRYTSFLRQLAEAWGQAGELLRASEAIDRALDISARHDEQWADAELLRVKGELILLQGEAGSAPQAEICFRQALERARTRGALYWELRAAISLARLQFKRGRCAEAKAVLGGVYGNFTEGFEMTDLAEASTLLASFDRGSNSEP